MTTDTSTAVDSGAGEGTAPGTDGAAGPPTAGVAGARPPARRTASPRPYRPRRQGWGRWAPAAATAACIGGVIAVTLWQLHPNLLVSNTSTTGGDTGAHYMLPAYIRSVLLPHGQLTGWDPAWYDGFPLYTFYFVLPDLWAALTSFIVPYNIAFKWATVLGSVTLPVTAWAMGRLFRLRPPVPAVLAAATLPFLFDYTWTIYGGNLFSTLAGEYAFSLSLSLALLFLGLFAWGIRHGRRRGWAAVVLALCIAAHIVPAMFAVVGAALLTVFELVPRRYRLGDDWRGRFAGLQGAPGVRTVQGAGAALWWGVSTVGLGVLLSGWWLVPFGIRQPYSDSMGYTNVTTFRTLLFPVADRWAVLMAAAAVLVALAVRSRFALFFSLMWGISALAVVFDPQGKLYNTRFLPFWFLCAYVLAGWVLAVACAALSRAWRRLRVDRWARSQEVPTGGPPAVPAGVPAAPEAGPPRVVRRRWWRPRPHPPRWEPGAVGGALAGLFGACLVVVPPFLILNGTLPQSWWPVQAQASQVSGWAAYNYVGYEGQPGYPELQAIQSTMRRIGATDGCGRAMWEYNPNLDRFGTPMALMLLPYWTNGCIDSMEGLLFESSTTTPYHFLNQAELSVQPSEPMVGLDYGPVDVPLGVQHLQLLGVRYFMASSPAVQQEARADPSLHLLATIGPYAGSYQGEEFHTTWDVYEVADSQMVVPLHARPVVLTGVGPAQSSWLPQAERWYLNPGAWTVERTAGGPASWARAPAGGRQKAVPVRATTVSDVTVGNESISFHVSRIGTPVLVKVSYFPNWQAQGAQGPWRATPNLMVVVPTAHEVTLTYGTTNADRLGDACTLAGILLLAVPALWRLVRRRRSGSGAPVGRWR